MPAVSFSTATCAPDRVLAKESRTVKRPAHFNHSPRSPRPPWSWPPALPSQRRRGEGRQGVRHRRRRHQAAVRQEARRRSARRSAPHDVHQRSWARRSTRSWRQATARSSPGRSSSATSPAISRPMATRTTRATSEFFQDLFGSEKYGKGPVARLAILKRQGSGSSSSWSTRAPRRSCRALLPRGHGDHARPAAADQGGRDRRSFEPDLDPDAACRRSKGDGKAGMAREHEEDGDCNEQADQIDGKPQKKIGLDPRRTAASSTPPLLQGVLRPELERRRSGRLAERVLALAAVRAVGDVHADHLIAAPAQPEVLRRAEERRRRF